MGDSSIRARRARGEERKDISDLDDSVYSSSSSSDSMIRPPISYQDDTDTERQKVRDRMRLNRADLPNKFGKEARKTPKVKEKSGVGSTDTDESMIRPPKSYLDDTDTERQKVRDRMRLNRADLPNKFGKEMRKTPKVKGGVGSIDTDESMLRPPKSYLDDTDTVRQKVRDKMRLNRADLPNKFGKEMKRTSKINGKSGVGDTDTEHSMIAPSNSSDSDEDTDTERENRAQRRNKFGVEREKQAIYVKDKTSDVTRPLESSGNVPEAEKRLKAPEKDSTFEIPMRITRQVTKNTELANNPPDTPFQKLPSRIPIRHNPEVPSSTMLPQPQPPQLRSSGLSVKEKSAKNILEKTPQKTFETSTPLNKSLRNNNDSRFDPPVTPVYSQENNPRNIFHTNRKLSTKVGVGGADGVVITLPVTSVQSPSGPTHEDQVSEISRNVQEIADTSTNEEQVSTRSSRNKGESTNSLKAKHRAPRSSINVDKPAASPIKKKRRKRKTIVMPPDSKDKNSMKRKASHKAVEGLKSHINTVVSSPDVDSPVLAQKRSGKRLSLFQGSQQLSQQPNSISTNSNAYGVYGGLLSHHFSETGSQSQRMITNGSQAIRLDQPNTSPQASQAANGPEDSTDIQSNDEQEVSRLEPANSAPHTLEQSENPPPFIENVTNGSQASRLDQSNTSPQPSQVFNGPEDSTDTQSNDEQEVPRLEPANTAPHALEQSENRPPFIERKTPKRKKITMPLKKPTPTRKSNRNPSNKIAETNVLADKGNSVNSSYGKSLRLNPSKKAISLHDESSDDDYDELSSKDQNANDESNESESDDEDSAMPPVPEATSSRTLTQRSENRPPFIENVTSKLQSPRKTPKRKKITMPLKKATPTRKSNRNPSNKIAETNVLADKGNSVNSSYGKSLRLNPSKKAISLHDESSDNDYDELSSKDQNANDESNESESDDEDSAMPPVPEATSSRTLTQRSENPPPLIENVTSKLQSPRKTRKRKKITMPLKKAPPTRKSNPSNKVAETNVLAVKGNSGKSIRLNPSKETISLHDESSDDELSSKDPNANDESSESESDDEDSAMPPLPQATSSRTLTRESSKRARPASSVATTSKTGNKSGKKRKIGEQGGSTETNVGGKGRKKRGRDSWHPGCRLMKKGGDVLYNWDIITPDVFKELVQEVGLQDEIPSGQSQAVLDSMNTFIEEMFNNLCDETADCLYYGVFSFQATMKKMKEEGLIPNDCTSKQFIRMMKKYFPRDAFEKAAGVLYPKENSPIDDTLDYFNR